MNQDTPRRCRKCEAVISDERRRAKDCGLPKCKSKAYRLRKQKELLELATSLESEQRVGVRREVRDTEESHEPARQPRVQISLRLEVTVCKKLDELVELRGLDRNTAIAVAIVQDWLASIGTVENTERNRRSR